MSYLRLANLKQGNITKGTFILKLGQKMLYAIRFSIEWHVKHILNMKPLITNTGISIFENARNFLSLAFSHLMALFANIISKCNLIHTCKALQVIIKFRYHTPKKRRKKIVWLHTFQNIWRWKPRIFAVFRILDHTI